MTSDNHHVVPRSKKPEPGREAPPWWRHAPTRDAQAIDWAPGRFVKLRAQLRNLYWSKLCRPLTESDIATLRKRLVLADPNDAVSDPELAELLTGIYGFETAADGWHIPELRDHLAHAVAENERASARGQRGARARWQRQGEAVA
nr:hypothetical protein [uncultured Roseateles sp.]